MTDDPTTGAKPGAGATPAAAGKPTDDTDKPPAKDDELGDGGKAALQAERIRARDEKKRADDAEAALETLREATASESEKAVNAARKEGEKASDAKWQERIRTVEVRGALRGAGIANEHILGLAVHSEEFAKLAVADDGSVSGITEAVAAFKKNVPEAFAAAAPVDERKPGEKVPGVASGVQDQPDDGIKPGYDRLSQAYAELDAAKSKK
jgi:hypothetical protein